MPATATAARMVFANQGAIDSAHVMAAAADTTVQIALLPHVANGDAEAIKQVIARYGRLIWSMARRFERATAEDAVQEIFIDLWKSAGRFDSKVGKETTFVMMIARRRLIDRRRRLQTQPMCDSDDELLLLVDGANAPPDVAVQANAAARAIEQLTPGQRDVLLLSICYGLSHQEIADKLAMPLGTVKAHARRGLLAVQAATSATVEQEPS